MSHPAFTDDDKVFIRAIMNNPAELTTWLVYADWLAEHDDQIRADFLRLSARLGAPDLGQDERYGIVGRLQDLHPLIDGDWLAVFDRAHIENCDRRFAFQCPKQWQKLKGTDEAAVRHCDACGKKVYYCHSVREAYDHARRGDCVAVDSAVPRLFGDLRDPDELYGHVTMGVMRVPAPELDPAPRRPWWKFWSR
jgi:uncharacterized protein (TIGR02996 family)